MYQFTEQFGDLGIKLKRKTYRWRGLAAGVFGGWVPAWGLCHGLSWGGWAFAGIWVAAMPAGYYLGKIFKK